MPRYSPHAAKAGKHTAQDGSILTMAAIVLSTAVILLASIDIGFLFYQKRELQKIADMAAIAGAQQLAKSVRNNEMDCAAAFSVATSNANLNSTDSLTRNISCGQWDPVETSTTPHYVAAANGQFGLNTPNAVQVVVERTVGSFFRAWSGQRVHARAIAKIDPAGEFAVFSVGSRLLRIQDGVVPLLLSTIGLDISGISATSYEGIANAKVNTRGLLQALGFQIPLNADVGTLNALLETNAPGCGQNSCSLGALLQAISGSIGDQQNLINLLGIQAEQLDTQIKLLSDQSGRGLFAFLETATGQSALKADIAVIDLVTTALQIANKEHAITLTEPGLKVNLGTLAAVETKIGIVEPPSIGIGGKGTKAYTSQVRLYTNVTTNAALPNAALVKASIPTVIDLVNGHGEITSLCEASERTSDGQDTATIKVTAPVLGACVGKITEASIFSRSTSCESGLGNHELLSILGNTLKVEANFKLNALENDSTVTLTKGQTKPTPPNPLPLGATLTNLYKNVLIKLLETLLNQREGSVTPDTLASNLLSVGNNVLNSTVKSLQTTLNVLQTFLSSINQGLLTSIGNLLGNLLKSVGDLLSGVVSGLLCGLTGNYNQCMLKNELIGSDNGISKVLVTLLGLVTQLLEPILNNLGEALAQRLENLLGIKLGQVDVTLIDLQCGNESGVRLVH